MKTGRIRMMTTPHGKMWAILMLRIILLCIIIIGGIIVVEWPRKHLGFSYEEKNNE